MTILATSAVTIRESIAISAAPDAVWRVFARVEDWPRWNPACAQARWAKGEPWAQDSEMALVLRIGGQERGIRVKVTAAASVRHAEWRAAERSYGAHSFTFEAQDGGTKVISHHALGGGAGLLRWLLPLPAARGAPPGLREMASRWLQALKAEVEKSAA